MSSIIYRAVAALQNETGRWFVLIYDKDERDIRKARVLVKNKKAMFFDRYNDILQWTKGINAFLDGTTEEIDGLTENLMTRQVELSTFTEI